MCSTPIGGQRQLSLGHLCHPMSTARDDGLGLRTRAWALRCPSCSDAATDSKQLDDTGFMYSPALQRDRAVEVAASISRFAAFMWVGDRRGRTCRGV